MALKRRGNNLAVRSDVMNKNIIRAIKREIKVLFADFIMDFSLQNTKEFTRENIILFSRHICNLFQEYVQPIEGFSEDKF